MLFNNTNGCVGNAEMLIIEGDKTIGSTLLGNGQMKKHAVYLKQKSTN